MTTDKKSSLNRREYVSMHISFFITWLLASCKPEEKVIPPVVVEPIKKLELLKIFPEIAISGSTLDIHWVSENIDLLTLYIKMEGSDWEIAADGIDAHAGLYHLTLPLSFTKDTLLTIKLSGEGKEAIKEGIKTENSVLPKSVEIVRIEPEEAIAGETLAVFFISENISLLTIELRDSRDDLLLIRNVLPSAGSLKLPLPDFFNRGEQLSLKISGDGEFYIMENIRTKNILWINTVDYPSLQSINGMSKAHPDWEDIWLKRKSEKELLALSSVCTHSGCRIDLFSTGDHFYCSCHGSKFSSDGLVLNGPANEPLKTYQCEWVADEKFKLIY